MDINALKSKLASVPGEIFATTVKYRMDLPFSTRAIKKGMTSSYNLDQCYRETERVGKIKSKYVSPNAQAGQNTITGQPPKGFTGPTAEDEKGLFYYGITSGEAYLIIQQSGMPSSVKMPVKSRYFINNVEVPFADIQNDYSNGIFTKKAIEVPGVRDFSLIPVSKIFDIEIDSSKLPKEPEEEQDFASAEPEQVEDSEI